MIKRILQESIVAFAKQFPVIAITGPRQSGKTTLARETFPHYRYVLLENPDEKLMALDDPRLFFQKYENPHGIIIDEIQEVPHLLSYMQGIVDSAYRPGYFVITGSQNLLIHEKISQSLAGRIALMTLLPLSISELRDANMLPPSIEETLFNGMYPQIHARKTDAPAWFANYIATYVERDARLVINIGNLVTFQRFLKLCAGRIGQLLNYTALANDCGVSANTAKAWISLLEASYIIHLVQPYYKHFNRRIVKTPKLHFYDTGLACALLDIDSPQALFTHYMRGPLFESFVVSELIKCRLNQSKRANCYFWRDTQGHEIDCLLEYGDTLVPIEIKSGMTINQNFFSSLISWKEITKPAEQNAQAFLVYAGKESQERKHAHVLGWTDIDQITQTC